jgi:hypothetical protein
VKFGIDAAALERKFLGRVSGSTIVVGKRRFALATWNARALFHRELKISENKLGILAGLLAKHEVVLLQETHGDDVDMLCLQHRFRQTYSTRCSLGPAAGSGGGCSNFVARKLCNSQTVLSSEELAPGRALLSSAVEGQLELHSLNLRNFGLRRRAKVSINNAVIVEHGEAKLHPKFVTFFAAGDWHYHAPGGGGARLTSAGLAKLEQ